MNIRNRGKVGKCFNDKEISGLWPSLVHVRPEEGCVQEDSSAWVTTHKARVPEERKKTKARGPEASTQESGLVGPRDF